MKKNYFLLFTLLIASASYGQTTVFINELHYDDASGDSGEGVEIAGPAGTDLSTYTLTAYNGSNGTSYNVTALAGTIPNEGGAGYGAIFFAIPGLQNGAPDGVALDNNGTLIQFLSYEGSFAGVGGVADGITSTDIGVSETSVPDGQSLQLTGSGTVYENFTWSSAMVSTYNAINTGQTFGAPVASISITSPADSAVLPSGTTSVDIDFVTTNLGTGDQVDFTVTKNAGTPTTTVNVLSSPFTITPTADGDAFEVTAEIINGGVIDSVTINFTISFPCDLVIGAITPICDALTAGVDTYTTTIDFTGGGTSTYNVSSDFGTIDLSSGNPSVDATGTITITGVNEGTDVVVTFSGDPSNSSCDFTRNINSPTCVIVNCSNSGDIIITEIMQNPSINSDPAGEYFEVYNTSGTSIDMIGWIIKDEASVTETHTISSNLIVPAGGYAVIGNGAMPNGGVSLDYTYDNDISLGNSTDGLVIECSSTVIDQVVWDNGATFPDPSGASMELSTTALNSTDNDNGANWGTATSAFGGGDLGTPGAVNDFTLSNMQFDTNKFNIYPNPTNTGFVNITSASSGLLEARIFDILGKQVLENKVVNNQLNVSGLNVGVYILRLTQNNASVTKKLVIK